MFSGLSESAANGLYAAGNFLVVIGALAILLGAMGSVWGGRAREKYSGERLAENQKRTQQALRDATGSTERLAAADERAAKANERAAAMEKEAANARLAAEKLKVKAAWREITEEQARAFVAAASALPKGKIEVQYLNTDLEAASFAAQLCEIFLKAGFDAPDRFDKMYGVSPKGGMMIGVNMKVSDPHNQTAIGLQEALKKINVDVNGQVESMDLAVIAFDVGQKPPELSK